MLDRKITIDELWSELAVDPYYSDREHTRRLIDQLPNHESFHVRRPWLRHPSQVIQADLVHAWCALAGLNTYLPGSERPTGWCGHAYAEQADPALEIDHEEFKHFLFERYLPLPAFWFPDWLNNTEKWGLDWDVVNNPKYKEAWEKACKLGEIKEELERLRQFRDSLNLNPRDPEYLRRRGEVEAEIARLNAQKNGLDYYFLGYANSIEPTPDRRKHGRRDRQI